MITSQYPGTQGQLMGAMGNSSIPGVDFHSLATSIAQNVAQALPGQGGQAAQYGAGVAPQGFDLGHILSTVAQGAAQALPGLLMSLLSSQPQFQQLAAQSNTPGVAPQSFNLGIQTPFGGIGFGLSDNKPQIGMQSGAGAGFTPQGFDLGGLISSIAGGAAKVLPGLLMGLLSAHPQLQQLTAQGGAAGVAPQSLFNFGVSTPFGGAGIGLFDNKPQLGAGVAPQGFDLGSIINTVAGGVAKALPGLLMGLLSSQPQLQQFATQGGAAGVAPQSLFNFGVNTPFGGAGIGLFDNKPQFGTQPGVAPQGFDFSHIINTVAQTAAQALPNLLMSLLNAHPQSQQLSAQGIDLGAIARSIAGTLAPQLPGLVQGVMGTIFGNKGTLH